MTLEIDDNYVLSIAAELKNLVDFVPPLIISVFVRARDYQWKRERRDFIKKIHPEVFEKTMDKRVEVLAVKNSLGRRKKGEEFVKDFVEKYPEYSNIIKK
jgi:hypothetical protein